MKTHEKTHEKNKPGSVQGTHSGKKTNRDTSHYSGAPYQADIPRHYAPISELTLDDIDFTDMVRELNELTLDDKDFEPLFRELDKLNKEFLNGINPGDIWDNVPRINPTYPELKQHHKKAVRTGTSKRQAITAGSTPTYACP